MKIQDDATAFSLINSLPFSGQIARAKFITFFLQEYRERGDRLDRRGSRGRGVCRVRRRFCLIFYFINCKKICNLQFRSKRFSTIQEFVKFNSKIQCEYFPPKFAQNNTRGQKLFFPANAAEHKCEINLKAQWNKHCHTPWVNWMSDSIDKSGVSSSVGAKRKMERRSFLEIINFRENGAHGWLSAGWLGLNDLLITWLYHFFSGSLTRAFQTNFIAVIRFLPD